MANLGRFLQRAILALLVTIAVVIASYGCAKADGPRWEYSKYRYYESRARCAGDREMERIWGARADYEKYRMEQVGTRPIRIR